MNAAGSPIARRCLSLGKIYAVKYIGGANYYVAHSRNYRVNFQIMDVNRSPVNSTFGYYVGGQKGTTVSVGTSVFF